MPLCVIDRNFPSVTFQAVNKEFNSKARVRMMRRRQTQTERTYQTEMRKTERHIPPNFNRTDEIFLLMHME